MMASPIVFLWDNFGPLHVDRCDAVADRLVGTSVIGIELDRASETYDWVSESGSRFEKRTLFEDSRKHRLPQRIWRIWRAIRQTRARNVFLCHYERMDIFAVAMLMRLGGQRAFIMSCSKFDDYARSARKEWFKSFFLAPYRGALSSGIRPTDYMRFLGVPAGMIERGYNTLSVARIRARANADPAPGGTAFAERHFTAVARFVPKKNLAMLIKAYALHHAQADQPRALHLCGSGPLEADLRALAASLGVQDKVIFRGFMQTADIAKTLGTTLALLLPSIEEQFGNVVVEAQAMGLPVILSDNAGARDELVRSGVNGFVVEPDNSQGMAYFMTLLSDDEALWARMAEGASAKAMLGDTSRFAEGVARLVARDTGTTAAAG